VTVYSWSSLVNGQSVAFNPASDQLYFEDTGFNKAAWVYVDYLNSSTTTGFTSFIDGKTVTLLTGGATLDIGPDELVVR
jgi:hypothetical protein